MKKATITSFVLVFVLNISSFCQYSHVSESSPDERAAVTIGLLNGGGGLIGADFEYLVNDKIGITAGIGFVSWQAGLNYHLKMGGVRSSYINIGYWHQGMGDTYVQSILGPSFIFRARKIFQAQIGVGAQLETGPAYSIDETPIVLMYSVGIYIPFR